MSSHVFGCVWTRHIQLASKAGKGRKCFLVNFFFTFSDPSLRIFPQTFVRIGSSIPWNPIEFCSHLFFSTFLYDNHLSSCLSPYYSFIHCSFTQSCNKLYYLINILRQRSEQGREAPCSHGDSGWWWQINKYLTQIVIWENNQSSAKD
jgi:hypothetical protein